jgi:hypothetical protein
MAKECRVLYRDSESLFLWLSMKEMIARNSRAITAFKRRVK